MIFDLVYYLADNTVRKVGTCPFRGILPNTELVISVPERRQECESKKAYTFYKRQ